MIGLYMRIPERYGQVGVSWKMRNVKSSFKS